MSSHRQRALRNRLLAGSAALAFVAHARMADGAAPPDGPGLQAWIFALGYGHLLGAVWLPRRRLAGAVGRLGPTALAAAFLAASAGVGLGVYAWLLARFPFALLPLLAIALWHTLENDLQLRQAYAAAGRLPRMTPLGGALPGLASSGLVAVAFGLALPPRAWGDGAAAVVVYHLCSWAILSLETASSRRRRLEIAGLHALPALLLVSGAPTVWLLEPGVYGYWSALHVLQTAWLRGPARA